MRVAKRLAAIDAWHWAQGPRLVPAVVLDRTEAVAPELLRPAEVDALNRGGHSIRWRRGRGYCVACHRSRRVRDFGGWASSPCTGPEAVHRDLGEPQIALCAVAVAEEQTVGEAGRGPARGRGPGATRPERPSAARAGGRALLLEHSQPSERARGLDDPRRPQFLRFVGRKLEKALRHFCNVFDEPYIKLGDDAAAAKQPNRNKNNTY